MCVGILCTNIFFTITIHAHAVNNYDFFMYIVQIRLNVPTIGYIIYNMRVLST